MTMTICILVNIKPRLQKVDWWQFGSKRFVFWLVIGLGPSETGYFSPSWDIQPERVLASIGQPKKRSCLNSKIYKLLISSS